MTANVLPFHDRFNANRFFWVSGQRLNVAGSETAHAVAEMFGFGFAEVADPTEEIIEGIPIIFGQRVGGVFRYFDEATHILDWQLQCTGPCFNHKIEEILPSGLELAKLEERVSVEQYRQMVVRNSVLTDFPAPDVTDRCVVSVSSLLLSQLSVVMNLCP